MGLTLSIFVFFVMIFCAFLTVFTFMLSIKQDNWPGVILSAIAIIGLSAVAVVGWFEWVAVVQFLIA